MVPEVEHDQCIQCMHVEKGDQKKLMADVAWGYKNGSKTIVTM